MSQNRAIVDKLLTGVSMKFVPQGHISELLLPEIMVKQSTGKLGGYGSGHLRIINSIIKGRGKARQVEAVVRTSQTYDVESHGLEGMVTADDYRNVEDPYNAESDEVNSITSILQLEKEKILADALSDTAVITQNTTLSGTDQFSDYANSDPMAVFKTAREAVADGCGVPPDTAWMDWRVKNVLKFHPQLLDMLGFKYNRPGGLNDQELAQALDVERILIAKARYQPAVEGQADQNLAAIWGKHLWFGVVPQSAQKEQTALGYRLGLTGTSPRQVSKWAINNPRGATAVLVDDHYDFLIANAKCAYLVEDAVE